MLDQILPIVDSLMAPSCTGAHALACAPVMRELLQLLMPEDSADLVLVLFGGEGKKPEQRKSARSALRALAEKYDGFGAAASADTLRDVARLTILVRLVHFPRLGRPACGADYGAAYERDAAFVPCARRAPDTMPQTFDAALAHRVGAHSEWDSTDEAAAREADSIDVMCEITGRSPHIHPWVREGISVECGVAQGTYTLPKEGSRPARNRGHFPKTVAVDGMARAMAGKTGKRAIVTRADKARSAIRTQLRKLEALEQEVASNADALLAINVIRFNLCQQYSQVA